MNSILPLLIVSLLSSPLFATPYSESGIAPWGVDADLTENKRVIRSSPDGVGKKICIGMIQFFQKRISPIDGPRSSYYPTSSQYTLEAIQKYGVLTGIVLGCDRLMRENKDPWVYEITSDYGFDRKVDKIR